MKRIVQTTAVLSWMAVATAMVASGETHFTTTNVVIGDTPMVLVGVSTNGVCNPAQFAKRVAEKTELEAKGQGACQLIDRMQPNYLRARGGGNCTIYCYNETVYDADVHFRSKKRPRKDWSSWWFELTVPANADGSPTFSLRRGRWYQFYFTILDQESTVSNEFKIRGKRRMPSGYLYIFYL